jgi:predicted deacylase
MHRAAVVSWTLLPACFVPRPIEPPARATPSEADAASGVHWRDAARSVEDRAIELCTVGHGPRRVLWIGGIHGDEREGRVATECLPRAVADDPALLSRVRLTLVRDLNPDGSCAGRRGNARGIDLNRNFPAATFRARQQNGQSPLDQPESRFLHDLLQELDPHLVIACHSSRSGPFVNWDGPAEALARQFSALSSYRVVRSDDLHATPGSLGSWVGNEREIAVLTLEFRRGADPVTAWQQTSAAILAVLAAGD